MDFADMPPHLIEGAGPLVYREPLTCWAEEKRLGTTMVQRAFWITTDSCAYVLTCDEAEC